MEGTGGLHILSTIIYTSVLILICLVSTLLVRDHIYIFVYIRIFEQPSHPIMHVCGVQFD